MAVPLTPAGFVIPDEHRTTTVWLRRQRPEDAESDHEAVMASRDALRVWCDGEWPADDFSLAENRADLAEHIDDAEAGVAFGYTVWDVSGHTVLGSLYLEPTAPFLEEYVVPGDVRTAIDACDVRVECWIRSDAPDALEPLAIAEVRDWLRSAWPFRRPGWGSRRGMHERRRHLEEAGMAEIAVIESRDGRRRFHFHAEPSSLRV